MQDKLVEISAIIGGLCIVARAIVAITPTPQDDIALKKVNRILKTIAWVFGLDLKQGMKKYSEDELK